MPDMLNLYKLVSEGEDFLDEFNENMTLRRNRHTTAGKQWRDGD